MESPTPHTHNDSRTLAIFEKLKEERDKQREERARRAAAGEDVESEPVIVPRMRRTTDKRGRVIVDLSKADPGCSRCGGTGRRPDYRVKDPESDEVIVLPVICVCVKRRGGVKKDLFDRMMDAAEKRARWDARRKERRRAKKKAKKAKRGR